MREGQRPFGTFSENSSELESSAVPYSEIKLKELIVTVCSPEEWFQGDNPWDARNSFFLRYTSCLPAKIAVMWKRTDIRISIGIRASAIWLRGSLRTHAICDVSCIFLKVTAYNVKRDKTQEIINTNVWLYKGQLIDLTIGFPTVECIKVVARTITMETTVNSAICMLLHFLLKRKRDHQIKVHIM